MCIGAHKIRCLQKLEAVYLLELEIHTVVNYMTVKMQEMVNIDIPYSSNIALFDMNIRLPYVIVETYKYPFLISALLLSSRLEQVNLLFPTACLAFNKPE